MPTSSARPTSITAIEVLLRDQDEPFQGLGTGDPPPDRPPARPALWYRWSAGWGSRAISSMIAVRSACRSPATVLHGMAAASTRAVASSASRVFPMAPPPVSTTTAPARMRAVEIWSRCPLCPLRARTPGLAWVGGLAALFAYSRPPGPVPFAGLPGRHETGQRSPPRGSVRASLSEAVTAGGCAAVDGLAGYRFRLNAD